MGWKIKIAVYRGVSLALCVIACAGAQAGAVHDAVNSGDLDGLRALLTASPDAAREKNNRGETPLHAAVIAGDQNMARMLLSAGADVNARDHSLGGTPLMMAAMLGAREILNVLLAEGAEVDAISFHGSTALHLAAHEGHVEIVRTLLNVGADPALKNRNGLTPLDLAMHMDRQPVAALLLNPANVKNQPARAESRALRSMQKQISTIESRLHKNARESARTESALRVEIERARALEEKSRSENETTLRKISSELEAVREKSDGAGQRLMQLQETMESEQTARHTESARLRETLARSLAESANLQEALAAYDEVVAALGESSTSLQTRFAALTNQFAVAQMEAEDMRRAQDNERIAAQSRMDDLAAQLDGVMTTQQVFERELRGGHESLNAQMGALVGGLDSLGAQAAAMEGAVKSALTRQDQAPAVQALHNELEELRERSAFDRETLLDLAARLADDGRPAQLNDILARLDAMAGRQAELERTLAAQAARAPAPAPTADVVGEILPQVRETVRGELAGISTRMAELESRPPSDESPVVAGQFRRLEDIAQSHTTNYTALRREFEMWRMDVSNRIMQVATAAAPAAVAELLPADDADVPMPAGGIVPDMPVLSPRAPTAPAQLASLASMPDNVMPAPLPASPASAHPSSRRAPSGVAGRWWFCAAHVHTKFSSGKYDLPTLTDVARAQAVDVIFLSDSWVESIQYGIAPLRHVFWLRHQNPSVSRLGLTRYLRAVDYENARQNDVLYVPGVEVVPRIYWTGSLPARELQCHNHQRNLIVLGARDDGFIEKLPVANGYISGRDFWWVLASRSALLLFLAACAALALLPRRLAARSGISAFLIARSFLIVCVAPAVLLMALVNLAAARRPQFDIYSSDPHFRQEQRVMDALEQRDLVHFWAHPEAPDHHEFSLAGFKLVIDTKPYPEVLLHTKGFTGFAGVNEGANRLIMPGAVWDQMLLEYLRQKRAVPPWCFGEMLYHYEGQAGKKIGNVQTVIWSPDRGESALLNALRKGAFYARRNHGGRALELVDWRIGAASGGADTVSDAAGAVDLTLSVAGAPAGEAVTVKIIRNGTAIAEEPRALPFDLSLRDNLPAGMEYAYYRVVVAGQYPLLLATNPIFVRRGASDAAKKPFKPGKQ